MEDRVDAETGELLPTTSERAVAASISTGAPHPAHLHAALMAAVMRLPAWITTDKDNEAFKRGGKALKYASLKTIIETVRPHLHEQGLRLRQGQLSSRILDEGGGSKGRIVPVFTQIIHAESGEHETTEVEIPLTRMDAQAMGSAITYGRRYSLLAALGLATDEADDDGEAAKPVDITKGVQESTELVKLKKEIDTCKDATDLIEWGEKVKAKRLADKLASDEQTLLRKHYGVRLNHIMNAPEEEPKKKGKPE